MNLYLILFTAISFEVLGTMLLPVSQNFTRIIPTTLLLMSYGVSFYLLAILSQKIPLAIIYAVWSGLGIVFISLLSYIIYKQTLSWQTLLGLFLIVMGVTLANIFKGAVS
ncbi:MAG TPA: multidrug efflux SMR transporter [Gammaproteobacteria bacterium]|nr:multidrug efflux SMR transporter [Gammaproteobacteria bacterium]